MTVLEAIQRSAEFLDRKGVESPRLQAELLLAHVLGCERMRLYLDFERRLEETQVEELRALVKRRGTREPLQHILGRTSFCGFEIRVTRAVLVPRPETELLAEMGWKWLCAQAGPGAADGLGMEGRQSPEIAGAPRCREGESPGSGTAVRALDFGTGSGCIAVALAKECGAVRVTAVDRSPAALAVARESAAANGVAGRVEFVEGHELVGGEWGGLFDLVISNPPYIPAGEIAALSAEVRDYELREALDGGPDGLEFFRMLAAEASHLLSTKGRLMVEFGDGQGPAVRQILEGQNWIVEPLIRDYNGKDRIAVARRV